MGDERESRGPGQDHASRVPEPASVASTRADVRTAPSAATLIQAKLTVGPAGDRYEQEADRIAAAVVADLRRAPHENDDDLEDDADDGGQHNAGRIRRAPMVAHASGGRHAPAERIQPKAVAPTIGPEGGDVDDGTAAAINRARGAGEPLGPDIQGAMERSFGADFSGVRVHAGNAADDLNRSLQARAFTTGQDIFFRSGDYRPDDRSGQELLAHELTHVVQQGGASTARRSPATIQRDDKVDTTTTVLAGTATPDPTETATDVFDGTTKTTTSTSTTAFSGAQVTKKQQSLKEGMEKLSPTQISETIEYMARAGYFGEDKREAAISRGPASASASLESSGRAGGSASMKSSVEVDWDAFETLKAMIELGAEFGAGFDVKGGAEAALGPLKVGLDAKLSAFAGAYAKASGKASIGPFAVDISGSASAMAGAEASGEVAGSIAVSELKITATLEGEALAGAKATAEAGLKVGLSGVSLTAKAEAFAGVKAAASGSTALSLKGVTFLKAKGTVEVSAGVGGKAKGEFTFEAGKLKIGGGLAATLGLGIGTEVEIEIDFVALADGIQKCIVEAFYTKKEEIERASPGVERIPLIDEELIKKYKTLGYDTVIGDLQAYAARLRGADPDRATVQSILDNRNSALKDAYKFIETDQGIRLAIAIALPTVKDVDVQAGQLRMFRIPDSGRDAGEAFG